jgi:hypothetical protein
MTSYGDLEHPRGDELVPGHPDLELFAHIEGLCGEEEALLAIPPDEREPHHHHRLRAIGEELDRAWEKLRERADRLGRGDGAEHAST